MGYKGIQEIFLCNKCEQPPSTQVSISTTIQLEILVEIKIGRLPSIVKNLVDLVLTDKDKML